MSTLLIKEPIFYATFDNKLVKYTEKTGITPRKRIYSHRKPEINMLRRAIDLAAVEGKHRHIQRSIYKLQYYKESSENAEDERKSFRFFKLDGIEAHEIK